MIFYHGTPITPDTAAAEILRGRHALVSFAHPEQLSLVADVCQSFVLDNGAFSFWRGGQPLDVDGYIAWVDDWHCHPGFDWALIPDIIDGTEADNDALLAEWPFRTGVPVWHMHESLDRLNRLICTFERVAIGSSGEYEKVGSKEWWNRIETAMRVACDREGYPRAKLHGLRMLSSRLVEKLPFASADSTNIARNIGLDTKWKGTYAPPTKGARGLVMAMRIEAARPATRWRSPALGSDSPETRTAQPHRHPHRG